MKPSKNPVRPTILLIERIIRTEDVVVDFAAAEIAPAEGRAQNVVNVNGRGCSRRRFFNGPSLKNALKQHKHTRLDFCGSLFLLSLLLLFLFSKRIPCLSQIRFPPAVHHRRQRGGKSSRRHQKSTADNGTKTTFRPLRDSPRRLPSWFFFLVLFLGLFYGSLSTLGAGPYPNLPADLLRLCRHFLFAFLARFLWRAVDGLYRVFTEFPGRAPLAPRRRLATG